MIQSVDKTDSGRPCRHLRPTMSISSDRTMSRANWSVHYPPNHLPYCRFGSSSTYVHLSLTAIIGAPAQDTRCNAKKATRSPISSGRRTAHSIL